MVTPQREQAKSTAGRKETKCSNDLLHLKLLGSNEKEVSEKKEMYISLGRYHLCHIIILNQVGTYSLIDLFTTSFMTPLPVDAMPMQYIHE